MAHLSKKAVLSAVAVAAACLIGGSAEAKITVNPDFQGTLLVTFPDGKVQMYDAGEALPDIPSGSSIEVFGGKMTVSTDEGDSVKVSCLGSEGGVGGGGSATVGCGENEGKLSVIKGTVQMTSPDGSTKNLTEGQDYSIKSNEGTDQASPATSEGNPLGTPAPEVNPPDSRSLEASPSQ